MRVRMPRGGGVNPLALFLFIVGAAQLPGALILGGHNGLTVLGVVLVVAALIIQTTRPRKARR